MASIRAVIFDLGHTLWDFAPSENGRHLNILRMHRRLASVLGDGVPSPHEIDRALGAAVQRWIDEWNGDRLEQAPSESLVGEALAKAGVVPQDGLLRDLTSIFLATEVDMPVVEPDSLAAIATLHGRGLALGCITNTLLLEDGILDALRRLGLLLYLRSVVVSSAMGYCKPHASLFRRALDELGVAAHEAVFVGDRMVDDVGGAQAVGMRTVLTHQYRREDPGRAPAAPDSVIGRLSELPAALERLEAEG